MCKCASARRSCHARGYTLVSASPVCAVAYATTGENAAARYQRQYRDANQRKRDIRKRHGVPPSMHRLFQTSHAFRHFAARVDYSIRSLSSSAGIVAEVYTGSKATKHRDCRRQHRQPNNRWQRARERISASNFGFGQAQIKTGT